MRLLLDTHVAVWAVSASHLLAVGERDLIIDDGNEVYVSSVSIFEIAVKHGLARKGAPPFSGRTAISLFGNAGLRTVDVTPDHAASVETLPNFHADPFDRLLVAQAVLDGFRLLTHDATVARYHGSIMHFA